MTTPRRPSAWSKLLLSSVFIIISMMYALWQRAGGTSSVTTSSESQPMMPAMMPGRMGAYIDGSYTGTAVDAYYGTVQVKAVVRSGRLTDVVFLQHPDNQPNSRYVNGQAMPLLTQEAIRAQSARVDSVSGATFTSQAFEQSLASALAQAKN